MVEAVSKQGKQAWQKWLPVLCAGVGLLGVLTCGYGYAAQSTDLLIEGGARVAGNVDVYNTKVQVLSKTGDAAEGYNAEYSTHEAKLFPQIGTKGDEITYAIATCNSSKTKTYELTGLDKVVEALGSLNAEITKIEVGTRLVLGTKVAPGECVQTEVKFTQDGSNADVASLMLDYEWTEYNGTPFSIDYMQDMTPEICAATSERETKQLEDKRDGHKYWVTKMHDGRCWMAQDLDYDGGGDIGYTREQVDNLEWDNDGTSSPAQYMYNGDWEQGHESDGSYYSYMAAMNVCPIGWRLATGGVGGEWDKLVDVAELNELGNSGKTSWPEWWERVAEAPFYLRATGYVDGKKGLRGLTTRTGWTSTRSGARPNTSFAIGYGDEYPDQKYYVDWDDTNFFGEPARCIAKTGSEAQVKELLTIETMQEMTADVCAVSQEGDAKQLVDERDGKKYWVTKLPDGQCWMTQNLDYDGGGTRFDDSSDISKWDSAKNANPANYYYRGDNELGRESLGSLYSYKAANSVCPTGWRLPIGGPNGDYYNLLGDYAGTTTTAKNQAAAAAAKYLKSPYFFVYGGWVDANDGFVYNGTRANYRSARVAGDSTIYTLDLSVKDKVMRSLAGDDTHYGESVRCVYGEPANEPQDIYTIETMQELTTQICMNTTLYDNQTRRLLTDTRDGHKYWISRLSKDGNCWMVQNLDYDGGGTRFDSTSDFSKWENSGWPEQYYYRGDWQDELVSYGSLYTWKTAQNVCPAGWRLPTTEEEVALWSGIPNSAAGVNKLKAAPFYFVTSGYVEPGDGVLSEGKEGYWWASTQAPVGGYAMAINVKGNGYVRPNTDEGAAGGGSYWGESVRCMMSGN